MNMMIRSMHAYNAIIPRTNIKDGSPKCETDRAVTIIILYIHMPIYSLEMS